MIPKVTGRSYGLLNDDIAIAYCFRYMLIMQTRQVAYEFLSMFEINII